MGELTDALGTGDLIALELFLQLIYLGSLSEKLTDEGVGGQRELLLAHTVGELLILDVVFGGELL